MFADRRRFGVLMVPPVQTKDGDAAPPSLPFSVDRMNRVRIRPAKLDKVYSGKPKTARLAHSPKGAFGAGIYHWPALGRCKSGGLRARRAGGPGQLRHVRSEDARAGKEWVSTGRYWSAR